MVLADHVHRDEATGKFFILGTYSCIRAASFPACHPRITVYLALINGRGPTSLKVRLVDADESRLPVFESEGIIEMTDPNQVVEAVFLHTGATFPEAGDYRLQLFAGENLLRETRLQVILQPTSSPAPHFLPPTSPPHLAS